MELLEFTTTRHNPGIDPHLHIWGWEIPVYLYLGGLVAGIMVLSGYRILTNRGGNDPERPEEAWPWAPMLGVLLLSAGMGALFLDLGHRWHVWRLYVTFQLTSPMSWGSWILMLVYPALLAAGLLHPPERVPFGRRLLNRLHPISAWMHVRPSLVAAVGMANLLGGIALGVYTGILLGTLGARPLWSSAALGPLFLLSGLSTAAALKHLLTLLSHRRQTGGGFRDLLLSGLFRLLGEKKDHATMVRFDNSFLTLELATLMLFLLGLLTGSAAHREAAALLLTGPWAPLFWCGVVISGILVPLVLQSLELYGRITRTVIPALLVLGGGFILRWVLVFAGQASHWN